MIQKEIDLSLIKYVPCAYDQALYASIKEKGILIAIKVNCLDEGYECVNGNKRLTVLNDLVKYDKKFSKVPCMLINDFSKAGSSYWGNTQNHH